MDPKQLAVYEEFARNVPGFLPSNDLSQPTGFLAQPMKVRSVVQLSFFLVIYFILPIPLFLFLGTVCGLCPDFTKQNLMPLIFWSDYRSIFANIMTSNKS